MKRLGVITCAQSHAHEQGDRQMPANGKTGKHALIKEELRRVAY